jgi:hypothetical protein
MMNKVYLILWVRHFPIYFRVFLINSFLFYADIDLAADILVNPRDYGLDFINAAVDFVNYYERL